jgi:acylphosphatase
MAATGVHIVIRGRVQGVGYRAWVEDEAEALGLKGWVRNRRDGTVEAVVSGDAAAVQTFLALCRDGPRAAIVSGVATEPYDDPLPDGFKVLPTA